MFPTKASIIVMSHLSDAEVDFLNTNQRDHIEFAKFVILATKGDLTQDIDADVLYEEFVSGDQKPVVELMTQKEIGEFVTDKMMFEIKNLIIDYKRLDAIKLLKDEAAKANKKISLVEAKRYIDNFVEFLKTLPVK